jgi:glycosyltransferase involved in cell wall biosynthesis
MARFLPSALESVIAQTFSDWEAIVVDDGSTDDTKEIVNRFIKDYGTKFRYIYQENQGVSGAKNTGIANSKGEYIALLDADDEWLPERLAEGVKVLDKESNVGLVHANSMRISEAGEIIRINKRVQRFLSGWIFEYLFLRKANISCPTVLFRRECIEKVGSFDEKLSRLGCEDRDLWLRIAKHYRFAYIDKVLARYRVRGSSMSKDASKMLEARYYVIKKFASGNKFFILKRRALQQVHRESGDELLEIGEYAQARKEYLKALAFWPFSFWTWFNLTKTFLKGK